MSPWRRRLGQEIRAIVLVTLSVTLLAVALQLWFRGWRRPQTVVFDSLPFGFLVSLTITSSVTVLLIATNRVVQRMPSLLRWVVWMATFVAGAAAGTMLAPAILHVAGVLPRDRVLVVFRQNILGTIPTSIVVGTFIMTVEIWRARLKATEAALHAQQIERERAERLASAARLAALDSRVQPHFLFNTLNAIAALVREDPPRAEEMVQQLSGVLRASLDASTTVPLEREMKLVEDYLRIQQTRLGDRLRFDIACDPAGLQGATLPAFAIQLLVENAIKHVAGRRPEGVAIGVRAARSGDSLLVDVRDDGDGFHPAAVKAGHGLDNLQARLRAIYGDRGRLEFDRRSGRMTVRVCVPLATADP